MNIKVIKSIFVYTFYIIIIIASLLSVSKSLENAKKYSIDFQYSPSKLLSKGINHYQYVLDGKHDNSSSDLLMQHQNGEYAHGMYILLMPFTYFTWDTAKIIWAYLNIFISIFLIILLGKKFNLRNSHIFIATSIYLLSTIYRINIGWGQTTTFIFLFFILPFLFKNKLSIILSGISYFKYNIGYALFLYFLSLAKIKNIFLSLIPVIIGWILYSIFSQTSLLKSLFEPLLVVQYLNLTLSFPIFFGFLREFNVNFIVIYALSIIVNFIFIYEIRKIKDKLLQLSLLCLTILIFVPHSIQDYLLLIPLLLFSIANYNLFISKLNLLVIFYFFFILRIISYLFLVQPWEFTRTLFWGYLNIFILFFLLILNLKILKNKILKY